MTDRYTLKPAGFKHVNLPDGTTGRVHHFTLYCKDEETDEEVMLVDEVEGVKIPIVLYSMPVVTGLQQNGPKLLVPNGPKIALH